MMIKKVLITDSDRQRAKDLVSQMTLEEKLSYVAGETPFSLRPVERLGIPRILLADGPQGIRNHCDHSTLYPSGIAAASTWNRDLIYKYGESLGNDSRARGVGILLGPGVNIYRYPLCGRNFEYMEEDPYLASEMACNHIEGVQSKGVIATIKHFAGNNQEWNRHHAISDIDERTLQEIYFPTFRMAIDKAGVGAVMNSYNLLNGLHSTENYWLNTEVLRDMWGFDRKASEVVQVYVKDLESRIVQPALALKGSEKITLNPGEKKEINITLDRDAFSYFDVDSHSFKVEPGEFQILVGNSSENLPLLQNITIQ